MIFKKNQDHLESNVNKNNQNEEIVINCYSKILGRNPDKEGLEYYSKQLEEEKINQEFR